MGWPVWCCEMASKESRLKSVDYCSWESVNELVYRDDINTMARLLRRIPEVANKILDNCNMNRQYESVAVEGGHFEHLL